jgi:ubiquinone/menaquinone biosynthesis C-methylase UbiE
MTRIRQRGLNRAQVVDFYDRFGAKQDKQKYYEDVALTELIRFAKFEQATAIVEFGCGTGRFAAEILPLSRATYWGSDVSGTMIELSRNRLSKYGERITLWKSSGGTTLPLQNESCDRFVSSYVFDILSVDEIESVVREAKRVLEPHGLLCLTELTQGEGVFSKFVTAFWNLSFDLNPKWVGGCRPITLLQFLKEWDVLHHSVVTAIGVSSEVVVAKKR